MRAADPIAVRVMVHLQGEKTVVNVFTDRRTQSQPQLYKQTPPGSCSRGQVMEDR